MIYVTDITAIRKIITKILCFSLREKEFQMIVKVTICDLERNWKWKKIDRFVTDLSKTIKNVIKKVIILSFLTVLVD